MSRKIILIPVGDNVGLTSVTIGCLHAIKEAGLKTGFFKPIAQSNYVQKNEENTHSDPSIALVQAYFSDSLLTTQALMLEEAKKLLAKKAENFLMQQLVKNYNHNLHADDAPFDIVLIEGLVTTLKDAALSHLNYKMAKAFDAEIVLVVTHKADTILQQQIEVALSAVNVNMSEISGVIINKAHAPCDDAGNHQTDFCAIADHSHTHLSVDTDQMRVALLAECRQQCNLPIIGIIPWNKTLLQPRAIDIAHYLNAEIIVAGDATKRRIESVTFCAHSLPNIVKHFHKGSLLVVSADRPEIFAAACLVTLNGINLGGIILTGGYAINKTIAELCQPTLALQNALPVFKVNTHTWKTAIALQNFNLSLPVDDVLRFENMKNYIAHYIDTNWIRKISSVPLRSPRLSSANFLYHLNKKAEKAAKRIILPEGTEPRIIKAAIICANQKLAVPILLGKKDEINRVAVQHGVTLSNKVEICDPEQLQPRYVERLVQLRQHKGMTDEKANTALQDNIMLATLMLENGDVDGLVAGAIHTTADTIRPAFQCIPRLPNCSLVSSIFFMLMPDQVLVFGDCAINPDPTAEQLADIAIQSADSASKFGITPRVAMISYSTGSSGIGVDVDKVRVATTLVQQKRADILIDGPLQYDAAINAEVARAKAPNSNVAGEATLFIFPDLNTGNTTYKAVQRAANALSIGPMLQGLSKPINDLSRGASVNDILYTIALTAIQADS